jgi:DNA/RNA endonuclease YhcR with UshA esterase domain
MGKQKMSFDKKFAIVLCIIGICIIGYFMVYLPFTTHNEGDPYFIFKEVPITETVNGSVIHLEDKDIMNIRGLDVRQLNGKITRIYFRYSDTIPEINDQEFNHKYGSSMEDPSSIRYLEYKGVYYYAEFRIP